MMSVEINQALLRATSLKPIERCIYFKVTIVKNREVDTGAHLSVFILFTADWEDLWT